MNDIVSAAEFSAWYSPARTLGLMADLNYELVAKSVRDALAFGDLSSAAATFTIEGRTAHRRKMPASIWRHWTNYREPLFWVTGDLAFNVASPGSDIALYGVRFDPTGVARLFPGIIGRPEVPESPPPPTKGGRPPAPWWDDLWIEILRQIYAGELMPDRQANIEKAMHAWVVGRGHEAGDTTIRDRARRLFKALNSEVGN